MPRRTHILAIALGLGVAFTPPAAGAPNDALQDEQWAFASQSVFNLPQAWTLSQGAGVVVAVVDSGMKLDHPDLAPNVWTNFGEIPGNGIDDDNNGYVDDIHGVDLTTTNANNNALHDGFGHGTHVSGTIAAAANGKGVVGVAFRAKLMTVKVLDDNGAGTTGAVAEGIRYAAANGARIINLSLETTTDDPRMREAVQAAQNANALVVASAGNSGEDVDRTPVYPVSIPAPNLVGVAATSPAAGRQLPDFSNYGPLTIAVAAPGVDVLSTSKDGGYETKSGTSMAAPHVSGVAALVAAVAPNLPPADLRAILLQNAVRGTVPVSSGYVDALKAVTAAGRGSSYAQVQRPQAQVLSATRKRSVIQARIALKGAVRNVAKVVVKLDGRPRAALTGGRSVLNVRLRSRTGRKLSVEALAANGARLAAASRRVSALRPGKRGVHTGGGVGGSVWAD